MKTIFRVAAMLPALLFWADLSCGAEAVKLRLLSTAYADGAGNALKHPEGVAYDEKSLLAVADTGNGKIQLYSFNDERLVPGATLSLPQLAYPIRLQFGANGEILALDGKSRKIVRLTTNGEFRGYLEPADLPESGAVVPRSFKVDAKGNIYLLDIFGGRLLVLDAAGKFRREVPFPRKHGFFSDLAVDGNGSVYLVDSVGGRVFVSRPDAKEIAPLSEDLKEDLDFPVGISVDKSGRLYLSDQNGGGVVILGPDGSFRGRQSGMGWKEGLLRYPSALHASEKGTLFVADGGNNRVQLFTIVQ